MLDAKMKQNSPKFWFICFMEVFFEVSTKYKENKNWQKSVKSNCPNSYLKNLFKLILSKTDIRKNEKLQDGFLIFSLCYKVIVIYTSLLQVMFSRSDPTQSPCPSAPLTQLRYRVVNPPPQSALHPDHRLQSSQNGHN